MALLCSFRADRDLKPSALICFRKIETGKRALGKLFPPVNRPLLAVLGLLDCDIYVPVFQVDQAFLGLPVFLVLLWAEESAVRTNNIFYCKTVKFSTVKNIFYSKTAPCMFGARTLPARLVGSRPESHNTG